MKLNLKAQGAALLACTAMLQACTTPTTTTVRPGDSGGLIGPGLQGLGVLPGPGPTPAPAPAATAAVQERASAVRYIGGNANRWPSAPNRSASLNPNSGYSDLYTRFVLLPSGANASERHGVGSDTLLRSYADERPNFIERLFVDERWSVTAYLKVDLLEPDLPLTIPLYSLAYNRADGEDEGWVTSYTSSHVRSPLFRITPNSRFGMAVFTSASEDVSVTGISTALTVVATAVQVAAPQSGLLTDLSSEENKDRAAALEGAISSLLSYNIDEEIEYGRLLSSWNPQAYITIAGCVPYLRSEGDDPAQTSPPCGEERDLDGNYNRYLGQWQFSMTCPQFSVFSPRTICNDANTDIANIASAASRRTVHGEIAAMVADSLVLELALAENVTLRSHVRGLDAFSTIVANNNRDDAAYSAFCAATMGALQSQGLTGIDSALGLRATLRAMPEFVSDRANLTGAGQGAGCRTLLGDYGVTLT